MTDSEAIEFGRKWVACRGFGWIPGMLDVTVGVRVYGAIGDTMEGVGPDGRDYAGSTDLLVPDIRDRATAGLLPGMVREARGEPHMYAEPVRHADGRWTWVVTDALSVWGTDATEPEAWLAAWPT